MASDYNSRSEKMTVIVENVSSKPRMHEMLDGRCSNEDKVLDRIKAVEDVGQFNFCVIADSKVLLMVLVKRKCRKIDMKPNEKCVGVLSGNAKAPCYMVLKDERKKDIVIRPATETTETKRSYILKYETHLSTPTLYCRFKDELRCIQNEFAVEAKKLKDRNRKRGGNEIENEQLQMALRVEERHEKMIEDVKCLKIDAPKTEGDTESKEVGTENTHAQNSSDLFNFQRTIARGTFGEVKEYTSIKTGRSFAIKELRRSHALNEMFINDREIQNRMLIKHKHIVRFFGAFKDESTIFIVLELMSQTLRQVMKNNGIMDEASSGVVPENILLSNERIKIGDFGLATTKTLVTRCLFLSNSSFFRGETWCGTPGYQAPELFRKETHGTPADMFSLGVMAHEMLESSLPFSEQYWQKHVIRSNTLQYVSPAKFSRHLKTLMEGVLNKSSVKRMSADDVLKSEWLFDLEGKTEREEIERILSEHL
ncbi:hypothetical protein CRE_01599 [Caenorhabditis remanei]|uniref:Protein kinase domain-containing protein n=1 Tax=Caenorhabditis remanei TaxID=31234 RepID=E3LGP8_CAERE|nr:hypothetical protein CRE_01599 [Caenorhabditis remanei]